MVPWVSAAGYDRNVHVTLARMLPRACDLRAETTEDGMVREAAERRDQRVSDLRSQTLRGYVWSIAIGLMVAAVAIGFAYLHR